MASDKLICLTGSGVSKTLKLKNGNSAPDWKGLLTSIKDSIQSTNEKLDNKQAQDLEDLLWKNATGEQLIEAASILYNFNKVIFNKALCDSVNLKEGETTDVHRGLLALEPKGILTYNYDVAHENAIKESRNSTYLTILPSDNEKIINLIKNNMQEPFLFKMHGSVSEVESLVLTKESYRNLFIKYPYYKAFIQHIFTNYRLLIVGFGLSDPDFELLLKDVFSIFGSPIQEHVVIKHIKYKTPNDTLYRLRYGLNFLYVEDFKYIPQIIKDCTEYAGNLVNEILEKCIDTDLKIRNEAHRMVRSLSNVGKRCLANILENIIIENISKEKHDDYKLNSETSEYVYTYGVIASSTMDKKYKDFLITNVVEKSIFSEPIAHALFHLRDVVDRSDLETVKEWMIIFKDKKFKEDINNTDPNNRVYKYSESMYYYLCAKYQEDM